MTLPGTCGLGVLSVGMLAATACLTTALWLHRRTNHLLVPHCVEEHDGDWYLRSLETGEAQLLFEGTVLMVPPEHAKAEEEG
jgi:hypothetical protein